MAEDSAVVDTTDTGDTTQTVDTTTKGGDTTTTTKTGDTGDTKGFWAEGWRERLAGEDKDSLKQLARYASPEDIWKKAKSLESRMSRGELKAQLAKDATPDQIKAWRAESGIPESPDKYDVKDVVPEKADKEIIGAFLKTAHDTNQNPDQVKANLKTFYDVQQQMTEARQALDADEAQQAEDTLRDEYGADYVKNRNLMSGLLDKVCTPKMKAELIGARLPNGKGIFNDPDMIKVFINLALVDNPSGVTVPAGDGKSQTQSMNDEIAAIEATMGTKKYQKDEKTQKRYRDLIDLRTSIAARGGRQ